MTQLLKVRVLSPEAVLFDGEAASVTVPTKLGYIGIRYNHNALLSAIGLGQLELSQTSTAKKFFVSGGYVEVLSNVVTILVDVIEDVSKIDVSRAEAAESRAKERLTEKKAQDLDIARALAALERAKARRKLAQLP